MLRTWCTAILTLSLHASLCWRTTLTHTVSTKIIESMWLCHIHGAAGCVSGVFLHELSASSDDMSSVPTVKIWDTGYEVAKHGCVG